MCGIIAVVRRRSSRTPPTPAELQGWLDAASLALDTEGWPGVAGLRAAADAIEAMDQALRGVPGVRALIDAPDAVGAIRHGMTAFESQVAELDRRLDAGEVDFPDSEVEAVNAGIVRLKDACWAVLRDRFRTADEVAALAGPVPIVASIEAFFCVTVSFSGTHVLSCYSRSF